MGRDMEPILQEIQQLKSDKDDLLTICASVAVTLRESPDSVREMVDFLFDAVTRYGDFNTDIHRK